ncbi:hypothetical protein D3C79_286840 [compost metagenome]
MINIDTIYEWNENDLGEESYQVQAIVSKGDLLDIITRLRESDRDAARYRWLIDNTVFESNNGGVSWAVTFNLPKPWISKNISESIDQAMKEMGDE